jgi:hypothetical protein
MQKLARFSQSIVSFTTDTVRDHSDGDIFVWVALFATTGLLLSLVAAMLGAPQIFD